MALALAGLIVLLLGGVILFVAARKRRRDQVESHTMTPEALHSRIAQNQEVLIFDVRLPLDLLAYPEIIPGARRIAPEDVLKNPSLIPRDKNTVVYCTCPDDETSRAVMKRAQAMQLKQVQFLKGGLAAWKAKGYPVEPYREIFHLYRTEIAPAGPANSC
jgi:rhodanese-related sulfurtransferase